MAIFGNILKKIFHPNAAAAPAAQQSAPVEASPASVAQASAPQAAQQVPAAASVSAVDVGAVLDAMASMKGDKGGNYRSSIVDLLKLLDLDSSLSARKELAEELGVHAAADGSAEQNMALHRAVMDKLAENGGIVPDSLRT